MKVNLFVLVLMLVLLGVFSYFALTAGNNEKEVNTVVMDHNAHNMKVSSERDFIEHMIPHHQEAIDTAQLVLEKGGTLRPLRELAEKIISAQTTEIEDMKSWYVMWYGVPFEDTGVYAPMMRPLQELSGADLDRVFLEDMILHHRAAITMAEGINGKSISQETASLAASIITTQENEIRLMEELLRLLPQ